MCGVMQTIIDKERASAEIARSKCNACNIWNNGEHDLNKIAETTLLSVELVRSTSLQVREMGLMILQICRKFLRKQKMM